MPWLISLTMLPCADSNDSNQPHCGQQRRREDPKEDPGGEEEKEHQLSRYAGRPFSKTARLFHS
jgi:hypothetical protein